VNREQQMVAAFHDRFGYPRGTTPRLTPELAAARLALIEEEAAELRSAWELDSLVHVADALGDLLYVVYGTFEACGIDGEAVFAEIHRSNMSKTPGPGAKPIKGPSYQSPNIEVVLAEQERRFAVQDHSGTVTIAAMESDSWQ